MRISYSARSARALAFLKQRYNDIDLYVEDASSPNMWLRVLKKLIPTGVRLESVNVLGGRGAVVEACELDQEDDGRKKLYIIDGDLDYIRGKRVRRLKHLYRIKAYCVENLLLSPRSVVEVGYDCSLNKSKQQVANEIDLSGLIGPYEAQLRRLFALYATAYELGSAIQSVGFSVHRLISQNGGQTTFDVQKIRQRILEFTRAVAREVGVEKFSRTRKSMEQRAAKLPLDRVVSGKDYLLPVVLKRSRETCGVPGKDEHFKMLLAKEFDVNSERLLAMRLKRLCEA